MSSRKTLWTSGPVRAQEELSAHESMGDLRGLFSFLDGLLAVAAGQLSEMQ